jgi:UDP-N-acetylmuramoyl-tripeptide--D-alanyl-D-alanine ligase
MNIEEIYKIYQQFSSIETDTRKIKKDDIFFALKGPNFNGNHFSKQALKAGAAYVVADEPLDFEDNRIIQVTDVLRTLPSPEATEKLQRKNYCTRSCQLLL